MDREVWDQCAAPGADGELSLAYSARISADGSARLKRQNSSIAPLKFRIIVGSFAGNPRPFQFPSSAGPTRNGPFILSGFSPTSRPLTYCETCFALPSITTARCTHRPNCSSPTTDGLLM